MLQDFFLGARTYSEAISMVSQHKLWKYIIIPGLISVVICGLIIGFTWGLKDDISIWIVDVYPFSWGEQTISAIASWLSILLVIVITLYAFKYLVMVIVGPFMGTLSEKVESIVTGKPAPNVSAVQIAKDIVRGLRIALRSIVRELFFTIIIILFFPFIPIVGTLLVPIATFFVQAYYAGFGNMDYSLERKRYNVRESVRFVRHYRWLSIGNGSIFVILFLIPVLGWFLAPAYGAVAATINVIPRLDISTK